MKLEIVKTKITIESSEVLYTEIKSICQRIQEFNKSQIGVKFPVFKRELQKKITELQFFELCKEANIEVRRNIVWFDQFEVKE